MNTKEIKLTCILYLKIFCDVFSFILAYFLPVNLHQKSVTAVLGSQKTLRGKPNLSSKTGLVRLIFQRAECENSHVRAELQVEQTAVTSTTNKQNKRPFHKQNLLVLSCIST